MNKSIRRNLIEMVAKYSLFLFVIGAAIRPLILDTPDFYWPFVIFALVGYSSVYYLMKNNFLGDHSAIVFFIATFVFYSPFIALSGGVYSHVIFLLPLIPIFAGLFISEFAGWLAATFTAALVIVVGTCFLPEDIELFSPDSIVKMLWLILVTFVGVAIARFFSRENQLLTETLEKQAHMDYLTLVPNRRGIEKILERELGFANDYNRSLAVMMIDIDYFKKFNDHNGHMSGDLWLTEIGKYLEEIVTQSGGYLGRYGGEEFIAVVPNLNDSSAQSLAESMCQAVREMKVPLKRGGSETLTISIGFSHCSSDGRLTESDMISRADSQLYKCKGAGRDRVSGDFIKAKSSTII